MLQHDVHSGPSVAQPARSGPCPVVLDVRNTAAAAALYQSLDAIWLGGLSAMMAAERWAHTHGALPVAPLPMKPVLFVLVWLLALAISAVIWAGLIVGIVELVKAVW